MKEGEGGVPGLGSTSLRVVAKKEWARIFSDVRVRIWMLKNLETKIQDGHKMDFHWTVFDESGAE